MCKILIINTECTNETNSNIRSLAYLTKLPLIEKRIKFDYQNYLKTNESMYYKCFNECLKNIAYFMVDERDSGGSFISEGSVIRELVILRTLLDFELKYKKKLDLYYEEKLKSYNALENAVLFRIQSRFNYIIYFKSDRNYKYSFLNKFNHILNDKLNELSQRLPLTPLQINISKNKTILKEIIEELNLRELTSINEATAFANNQIN